MKLFSWGSAKQDPNAAGTNPIWFTLQFLRRRERGPALTAQEQIDVLVQMVANLIDEVEILKGHDRAQSGLSHEDQRERYRKEKMWFLYSSAGGGACSEKYIPYLRDGTETAAVLIPDEANRAQVIEGLSILT